MEENLDIFLLLNGVNISATLEENPKKQNKNPHTFIGSQKSHTGTALYWFKLWWNSFKRTFF